MKKLLKISACVVSLIVLFCNVSFAQNTQQIYSSSTAISYMLPLTARVSTNGADIISTMVVTDGSEFIKIDPSNPAQSRRFTSDSIIDVEDMVVFDNYVYFCGVIDSIYGVWGFFKESEFGTNQVNVSYVQLPYTNNNVIAKKIRAYKDNDGQTMVVVLANEYNHSTSTPLIYRNHLYIGTITGGNFLYNVFFTSTFNQGGNNNADKIQDIALTDNYIVTVGVESHSSQEIRLIRIKKAYTSIADCRKISDPTPIAVNGPLVIESLKNDDVAFSALFTDEANNKNYARLYTFNMANFTNLTIQDVELGEKSDPDNLLYLPDDESLLLTLTDYNCPSFGDVSGVIFYLDPYATSMYTADFLYDLNQRFYSFDRFTGSLFLAGGRKLGSERMYLIRDKQAGAISNCYHYSSKRVIIRQTLSVQECHFQSNPGLLPVDFLQYNPKNYELYNGCIE